VYNGLGQRVKKTVVQNGVTTTTLFAYDEAGRIVGTYNADGSLVQEIVWFGDIPVVVITPSGNFYVHSDQLNTPREITNSAGTVVWKWENVDPFGANAANEDVGGDGTKFEFNHRFAGQYFDSETGLHQNYFRDYAPQTGRYIESDPIGLDGGIGTYTYVENNSLLQVDPLGLVPASIPQLVPWHFPGSRPSTPGIPGYELGDEAPRLPGYSLSSAFGGDDATTRDSSDGNTCCANYTNVYQSNSGKHGPTSRRGSRGPISREPTNGSLALAASVPVGRARIGIDPTTGELVVFRSQFTDEQYCIKYWHGYVVGIDDLTPEQWRAGRDAGFPKWPRKPR
jgi:RHS repeat-associated protein